jgi:small subunit ribosomal protein S13
VRGETTLAPNIDEPDPSKEDDTFGHGAEDLPWRAGMVRQPNPVNEEKRARHMARLVGVDLPRDKRMAVALTYIYGIGRSQAARALEDTGISPNLRSADLNDDQLIALRDWIDAHLKVEGDLRREVASDVRRKVEIGCYQGIRHRKGLPVRGQRTHTNARTRKGPRKTVAGKKKVTK